MALTLALAPAAAWTQTDADKEHAKDLFSEGTDLREQGNEKAALEKFRAAYELVRSPITTLEYGRSLMRLGKLIEARARFLEAKSLPVKNTESAQAKAARAEAAELVDKLLPRIPSLKIVIEGVDPMTVSVAIDGQSVASPSAIQKVNPGTHKVTATLPSGEERHANVDLKEGESRDVELRFDTDGDSNGASSIGSADGSTKAGPSPLTLISFGVAGAGVLVGTVTGLMAKSKHDELANSPDCMNGQCGPGAHDTVDSFHTLAGISTASFVIGGIAAGIGVVSLISGAKDDGPAKQATTRLTPWIGIGSAGITGAF